MIMTDPHLPIINRKLSTITKEAIESESECATCDRHTLLIVHFHVNIDTQLQIQCTMQMIRLWQLQFLWMKFNDTNLNQTNGRMCTLYIILPDKMGDYKDCFLLNSLQEFLERVEWEGCTIPPPPSTKLLIHLRTKKILSRFWRPQFL